MTRVETGDWEAVLTVNDYFDGPRNGVANLNGQPHIYKCEWDSAADDWSDIYSLEPISSEQLSLVLEEWAIWRRWRVAYDAQELAAEDRHPALAGDRARYDEIHPLVDEILKIKSAHEIQRIPEFRGNMMTASNAEVRWTKSGAR